MCSRRPCHIVLAPRISPTLSQGAPQGEVSTPRRPRLELLEQSLLACAEQAIEYCCLIAAQRSGGRMTAFDPMRSLGARRRVLTGRCGRMAPSRLGLVA